MHYPNERETRERQMTMKYDKFERLHRIRRNEKGHCRPRDAPREIEELIESEFDCQNEHDEYPK